MKSFVADTAALVLGAVPLGAAPGPDRLRVQHLLDIMASLTEEDRDTFLTALTSLTHMFQKGLLPEVIAQSLLQGLPRP
jgi:predicted alpha/beta-hydrolase family hydrolase